MAEIIELIAADHLHIMAADEEACGPRPSTAPGRMAGT